MKILFYTDSFRLGGKERQLVELIKGLKRSENVNLLVVCMDRGEFFEPDAKNLGVDLRFLPRKMRWDPSVLIRLYNVFAEFKPDIVHTNSLMTSAYALPLAKIFRIPLINGSIRNAFEDNGLRWKLERALLRCSDYRVANSLAGLRSRGFSVSSEKDLVIYNGFDLERTTSSNSAQDDPEICASKGGHVIGMAAEFRNHKDYPTFIRAALRLLETRKDVTFLTVGDGPTWEECKRLVPKDCDRILFLGRRKDVERIVSNFSVGVLATFTEGIPNFIMECMAAGKPVIVTDGGGSKELVLDGKTGFLVPPKDPLALAEKIEFLLDNPDIACRLGRAGRERIEKHFSLTQMIDETLKLYEHVLNGRTRSGPRLSMLSRDFGECEHQKMKRPPAGPARLAAETPPDRVGACFEVPKHGAETPGENSSVPNSLKVLFVTNMYPHAEDPASGTFVMHQAEQLRKMGHRVDVLHFLGYRSRLNYLKSAFDVFSRTRESNYDVVHAHYGLSGFPALFRHKVPLVVTLHGGDVLIGTVQRLISRIVSSLADGVIVVSKGIAKKVPGIVIPCGIDFELFKPRERAEARSRLGLSMNRRYVLFPFDPKRKVKRYDLATAACERLTDTDLLVVSGVRNDEMSWYYSAADVMLLCSYSEGSPTSVKEALACNLPVVSTNVGDVAEIMAGIQGCTICGTNDPVSLATALESVLRRPTDVPFESRSAMRRYDQQEIAASIVNVYKDAIKRRSGGPRPFLLADRP